MTDPHIAIVGGGISGASIAYHLSHHADIPVTVYERQALASETTTKSAAFLGYRGSGTPPRTRMQRYALCLYNNFLKDDAVTAFYLHVSRLQFADTTPGNAELKDTYESILNDRRSEAPVEYYPGSDLPEILILPGFAYEHVTGALFQSNVGYTQPHELAHAFIERAQDNGVTFRTNAPVDDITTAQNRVTGLIIDGDPVTATHVVAAAGPWNRQLAGQVGIDLPIRHSLAPGVILDPPTRTRNRYPSLGHHETGVYLRDHQNGTVFVGHNPGGYNSVGTEYDPAAVGDDVPADIITTMTDVVHRFVPSLYDATISEQWVGVRSLTPDSNPIIGWTAVEGFLVASYNATGIQLAPAAGRIIASQILTGDPTDVYDDVSITRFDGYSDSPTRPVT